MGVKIYNYFLVDLLVFLVEVEFFEFAITGGFTAGFDVVGVDLPGGFTPKEKILMK